MVPQVWYLLSQLGEAVKELLISIWSRAGVWIAVGQKAGGAWEVLSNVLL